MSSTLSEGLQDHVSEGQVDPPHHQALQYERQKGYKAQREEAEEVADADGKAQPGVGCHSDPRDPKTWPTTWAAADIQRFLKPHLKPESKVNFRILAVALSEGDYTSLNHHYQGALLPVRCGSLHEELVRVSKPIFKGSFFLLTHPDNWDALVSRSRNVVMDTYVEPHDSVRATPSAVCMLTCESGGGKTVSAIASIRGNTENRPIVFYCIAADISKDVDDTDKDKMRRTIVANLVAAMENAFATAGSPGLMGKLRETTESIVLGIVVDEAGGSPSTVRALCGVIRGLRAALGLPENVAVYVSVAGTGIGCGPIPPGSYPETYTLHHVTTGQKVWDALAGSGTISISAVVEEHARGSLVIKNPRFARLLWAELESATNAVGSLPFGAAAALVEACLVRAAVEFKRLNGLASLEYQDLLHVLGGVVAAIQTRNTPPVKIPFFGNADDVTHEDLSPYIRAYGMVVDNAVWSRRRDNKDVWGIARSGTTQDVVEAYLIVPRGERYTLSVSQSAIFLLLLGLVPTRSALSGETLESAVATLFPLLISAYRNRTVGEMLSVFGVSSGDKNPIQNVNSVSVVQYHRSGKGVLQEPICHPTAAPSAKGTAIDPTHAYVFVNGPKCPFANIVVAIPNCALILVQCKDYSKDLIQSLILEELHKMGHPDTNTEKSESAPPMDDPKKKSHEEKQKAVRALAEAFNVPTAGDDDARRITYLFVGSKLLTTPTKFAHADAYSGSISNLPTPLKEMLPFDADKPGGPPSVSNVGLLPLGALQRARPN